MCSLILPANWIGYACGFASNTSQFQWRFPLALQIPPGVILFIGMQFVLPDSPRWLIRQGRDEEARAAFTKIRGDLTGVRLDYRVIWRVLICVSIVID